MAVNIAKDQIVMLKQVAEASNESVTHILNNIKTGMKVFVPVADDLAYFIGEVVDSDHCTMHLGTDYYLSTNRQNAIEIISNRRQKNSNTNEIKDENSKKIELDPNVQKLGEDTFEIVENISEEDYTNMKSNQQTTETLDEDEITRILRSLTERKNNPIKDDIILSKTSEEPAIRNPRDIYNLMSKVHNDNLSLDISETRHQVSSSISQNQSQEEKSQRSLFLEQENEEN